MEEIFLKFFEFCPIQFDTVSIYKYDAIVNIFQSEFNKKSQIFKDGKRTFQSSKNLFSR